MEIINNIAKVTLLYNIKQIVFPMNTICNEHFIANDHFIVQRLRTQKT